MELPVFEMIFKKGIEGLGVNVFSLVEEPANESEMVFLSKEKDTEIVKLAFEESKGMIYAVALIPNQLILRNNPEKGAYNIVFREESIELAAQQAIVNGVQNISLDHSGQNVSGINLVESWIVADPKNDKANALGMNVPSGTWMTGFKADSPETMEDIKLSGKTGISIEGVFGKELVSMELTPAEKLLQAFDIK